MHAAWNRKLRSTQHRSSDWKTFLLPVLISGAITLTTIALVATSTQPSFENRSFPQTTDRGNPLVLDWPKLYSLSKHSSGDNPELRALSSASVRVPGYMLSFVEKPNRDGKVNEFLLVPDVGNWLHPPHLDPGEVVLVRTKNGANARLLDRRPIWVEGKLSPAPVNRGSIEGAFELTAQSFWEMAREK